MLNRAVRHSSHGRTLAPFRVAHSRVIVRRLSGKLPVKHQLGAEARQFHDQLVHVFVGSGNPETSESAHRTGDDGPPVPPIGAARGPDPTLGMSRHSGPFDVIGGLAAWLHVTATTSGAGWPDQRTECRRCASKPELTRCLRSPASRRGGVAPFIATDSDPLDRQTLLAIERHADYAVHPPDRAGASAPA